MSSQTKNLFAFIKSADYDNCISNSWLIFHSIYKNNCKSVCKSICRLIRKSDTSVKKMHSQIYESVCKNWAMQFLENIA